MIKHTFIFSFIILMSSSFIVSQQDMKPRDVLLGCLNKVEQSCCKENDCEQCQTDIKQLLSYTKQLVDVYGNDSAKIVSSYEDLVTFCNDLIEQCKKNNEKITR